MPKTGTELQSRFVVEFVSNGGNATAAAKMAGYSMRTAGKMGSKLLGNLHVQEAIRAEQRRMLDGDMATKALGVLKSIMENEEAPAGARVDAAKTILDRAGVVAPRVTQDEERVPLTQMSLDALRRSIAVGEARMAELQEIIRDRRAIESPASQD